LRIWDCGFGIADLGLRIWDCGFGIADLGLRIWDCGFGIAMGIEHRAWGKTISNFELRFEDVGCEI
jgi:hypothetical protein